MVECTVVRIVRIVWIVSTGVCLVGDFNIKYLWRVGDFNIFQSSISANLTERAEEWDDDNEHVQRLFMRSRAAPSSQDVESLKIYLLKNCWLQIYNFIHSFQGLLRSTCLYGPLGCLGQRIAQLFHIPSEESNHVFSVLILVPDRLGKSMPLHPNHEQSLHELGE